MGTFGMHISLKDILRVHSDIALPQSSPNIGHLLYDYVEVL